MGIFESIFGGNQQSPQPSQSGGGGLFGLNFEDPQTAGLLGFVRPLLSAKKGDNSWSNAVDFGLQAATQARNQQRLDRQNELQQLQGQYALVQRQEGQRMLEAAQQNGGNIPPGYQPNPMLAQIEARLSRLVGLNPATAGQPQTAPQTQSPQPLPPAQASRYSQALNPAWQAEGPMPPPQVPQQPQAPQQPQGVFGSPAGGMAAAIWAAVNGGDLSKYVEQIAKERQPIVARPGADLVRQNPDGTMSSVFQQLAPMQGMTPIRNAQGQVVGVQQVPGYTQGASAIKSAEVTAEKSAALPFEPPTIYPTSGSPTLMTREQAIRSAGGSLPGQGSGMIPGTSIPQSVLDAGATGRPFVATQSPGAPVQFQPPPSGGGAPGLRLQSESEKSGQLAAGSAGVDMQKELDTEAAHAVQTKRILTEVRQKFGEFTPGKLAPFQQAIGQWRVAVDPNGQLGIGGPEVAKQVAAMQVVDKQNAALATQAMKQFTNRGTQMEFANFLRNNPGIEMTPEGARQIVDFMDKATDISLNRQQSFVDWKKSHPDPREWQDFNAAWNANLVKNLGATLPTSAPGQSAPQGMQGQQPANLQKNMTATYKAQQAIRQGKPREAVIQRLIDSGYDPAGL